MKRLPWILVLLLALSACSDKEEVAPTNLVLVESSFKTEYDQETILELVEFAGVTGIENYIRYDLEIHKISYKTTVKGESVIASGVVAFPKDVNKPNPFLCTHRGTIFADFEAPSEALLAYGFELLATAGYAVVLPDMIGFGSTKDMIQHYYNRSAHSRVVIDMIKAGEEFFRNSGIQLHDQLFLEGYSQGGYITMATLQAIEADPDLDWNVVAAAAGAGSYDIEFVMDDVLERGVFTSPGFLSLIIYSYNEVNDFQRPLDDYFLPEYAAQIPGLLDGSSSSGIINRALPDTLDLYFQKSFMDGLRDRSETEMITAFQENSVYDWAPKTPVRFYHSSGDEFIPIEDSQNTAAHMKSKGADVTFIQIGDGDHGTSAGVMLQEVLPWFESLRTD